MSKHLDERQLSGLSKLGEALVPGDGEFPSFTETGCISEIDRLLDFMPAQDLSDLKMLFSVFSFFPKGLVFATLKILEFLWEKNLPMGSVGRLVRLGIRGIVMSLYYSGGKPYQVMGYEVSVYLADLKKTVT